jgi:hypothetical protein
MILVQDIPFTLKVDETFELIISGIQNPNYGTSKPIFVALDDDLDPSEVLEFGEVSDVDLQTALSDEQITLTSFSKESNVWIIQNDYTF